MICDDAENEERFLKEEMTLHRVESFREKDGSHYEVIRVVGGWIYSVFHADPVTFKVICQSSVFVPFTKE